MTKSKSPQILQIEPPEALKFIGPFKDVVTSELILTNPSLQRVAFKVKTTAPKRYCVRPNSGLLEPKEEVKVAVMLQPFDHQTEEKNKHKFMIQSLVVDSAQVEHDAIWKDADPDKLMDSKLRVIFENELQPVSANNLDVVSETIVPTSARPSSASPTSTRMSQPKTVPDEDYQKQRTENERLSKEVACLKEDITRLRKIALSENESHTPAVAIPTGVALLTQEKKNIFLILLFIISAFATGLFTSEIILAEIAKFTETSTAA